MNYKNMILHIVIMAGVTYLVRMLPLVIFRRKIENRFIRSFLYYMPFAVLSAMTFPAALSATGSVYSALCGLIVAIVMSFFEKGLITVALSACLAVFAAEFVGGLL